MVQNWPIRSPPTFTVMAALGYSVNILTLFGLVLAIGTVVDDAIVVTERVQELMDRGLNAKEATIQAMLPREFVIPQTLRLQVGV